MPTVKKAKNKAKQKPVPKPLLCSICAKPIGPGDDVVKMGKVKRAHETCYVVMDEAEKIEAGARVYGLTQKQFHFCMLYTTDLDHMGNGLRSYITAYGLQGTTDVAKLASAQTCSSRLLRNVMVLDCINKLRTIKMTHDIADSKLAALINQEDDENIQLGALKEYNRLHGRVTDKLKVTMTHGEMLDQLRKLHEGAAQ
jgi:hypothetical protein